MTNIEQYKVHKEPFYQAQGDEVTLYEAAYKARLPVMVKGPTGCGKSRFIVAGVIKADGEGVYALPRRRNPFHRGDDARAVDPAGQKRPQRHIRLQPQLHA